jgi:hypothetical protein
MGLLRRFATASLVCITLSCLGAPAAARSIVAVFDIEVQRLPLEQGAALALSDYLAASFAATEHYRVVPRQEIKRRLAAMTKESYKLCYDESCQIEIGRNLSADKSVATKIIRIDKTCAVIMTIYDLRSAATHRSQTISGGCSERDLVSSLSQAVTKLAKAPTQGPTPTPSSLPSSQKQRPLESKVTVMFSSNPAGADILLDGLARGQTPLSLNLERHRRYEVLLTKEHYISFRNTFVPERKRSFDVPLRPTEAGRREQAATSEWLGLGVGSGFSLRSNGALISANFRFINIKWYRFYWTILDIGINMESDAGGKNEAEESLGSLISFGTRIGYPIYFGDRGQHQLLFGLGFNYSFIAPHADAADSSANAPEPEMASFFTLSPGVDYVYGAASGVVPVGIGIRSYMPVAGRFGQGPYPATVMACLNIGFSLSAIGKNLSRVRNVVKATPAP